MHSWRTLILVLLFASWPTAVEFQYGQPQPTPTSQAASIFDKNTLLTVYGRSFNRAPILGRLGTYKNFEDMAEDVQTWIPGIKARNDGKGVIPALHLIYAMAIPCKPNDDCLLYLEGRVKDIAKTYIEPAAERGWAVVLDTQLGKSTPVQQINRIISKGYLNYDNVHVAIDPEFHVYEGRESPGIPIGTIEASQINEIQQLLDRYVASRKLPSKKILIVHQFGDSTVKDGVPVMIQDKKTLKVFENVDLVISMDGIGEPATKINKYNRFTDVGTYPFVRFRGMKVFFPNQWEKRGHYDKPPMTLDQIFGLEPVKGGYKIQAKPNVVIIA